MTKPVKRSLVFVPARLTHFARQRDQIEHGLVKRIDFLFCHRFRFRSKKSERRRIDVFLFERSSLDDLISESSRLDVARRLGEDFIYTQMRRTLSRPSRFPKRSDLLDRLNFVPLKRRPKFEQKFVRSRSRPAAVDAALLAVIEKFRPVDLQFLTENFQQLPIRFFAQRHFRVILLQISSRLVDERTRNVTRAESFCVTDELQLFQPIVLNGFAVNRRRGDQRQRVAVASFVELMQFGGKGEHGQQFATAEIETERLNGNADGKIRRMIANVLFQSAAFVRIELNEFVFLVALQEIRGQLDDAEVPAKVSIVDQNRQNATGNLTLRHRRHGVANKVEQVTLIVRFHDDQFQFDLIDIVEVGRIPDQIGVVRIRILLMILGLGLDLVLLNRNLLKLLEQFSSQIHSMFLSVKKQLGTFYNFQPR